MQQDEIPAFFFLAAHGGAGASTLGHIIAPGCDAHGQWPIDAQYPNVFIVCAATAQGLDAAHVLATQKPEGINLLGFIIVSHSTGRSPRLPKKKTLLEISNVFTLAYSRTVVETPLDQIERWEPGVKLSRIHRPRASLPASFVQLGQEISKHFVAVYTNNIDLNRK